MKKIEFDLSKLKGRIIEKFDSNTAFAKALGISLQQLSPKLNGKTAITKEDIMEWCPLLEIGINEIGVYFFTPKV